MVNLIAEMKNSRRWNFGQIGLPIITQFVIQGKQSILPKKDDIDMIVTNYVIR